MTRAESILQKSLEKACLSLDKFPAMKKLVLESMEEHAAQALIRNGAFDAPKSEVHAKRLADVLVELLHEGVSDEKLRNKAQTMLKLYQKEYPNE